MSRHLRSRLPNERQTLARDQSIDESGKFQRTFGVLCDLRSLYSGRLRGKPHSHILEVVSQKIQNVPGGPSRPGSKSVDRTSVIERVLKT
ncbi:hypothetical protein AYO47_03630 [Planctomyces sp. SCGC AG-212-M04]|nr:hypothetical protein AYO47_03630 [Planctomyces sp. SCGC AG-212-M04]